MVTLSRTRSFATLSRAESVRQSEIMARCDLHVARNRYLLNARLNGCSLVRQTRVMANLMNECMECMEEAN